MKPPAVLSPGTHHSPGEVGTNHGGDGEGPFPCWGTCARLAAVVIQNDRDAKTFTEAWGHEESKSGIFTPQTAIKSGSRVGPPVRRAAAVSTLGSKAGGRGEATGRYEGTC